MKTRLDDLTRKLMRIGLDNIMGYIPSTEEFDESRRIYSRQKKSSISTKFKSVLQEPETQVIDLRGAY